MNLEPITRWWRRASTGVRRASSVRVRLPPQLEAVALQVAPFAPYGAALGAGLAVAFFASRAAGAGGDFGGAGGGPYVQLDPSPGDAAASERARSVADDIRGVWSDATGGADGPSDAVLEILLAHAWGESGIGGWWHGAMEGSHNLGAIQCSMSEQSAGSSHPGSYSCADYQDSKPDDQGGQTKFSVKFKFYQDGDAINGSGEQWSAAKNAAWDFVHAIAHDRPSAFAALQTGDVGAYCAKLYDTHYYGGFGATRDERIGGYVKMVSSHLPAVAYALGHATVYARVPDVSSGTWTPTAVGI